MKIFCFVVGFVLLLVDLLWRLNIDILWLKESIKKHGFIGQKLKWLPTRFLLGVVFWGAYYFAMFKYLWLVLSLICFVSCAFWLLLAVIQKIIVSKLDLEAKKFSNNEGLDTESTLSHSDWVADSEDLEDNDLDAELDWIVDSEGLENDDVDVELSRTIIERTNIVGVVVSGLLVVLWVYSWRKLI